MLDYVLLPYYAEPMIKEVQLILIILSERDYKKLVLAFKQLPHLMELMRESVRLYSAHLAFQNARQ